MTEPTYEHYCNKYYKGFLCGSPAHNHVGTRVWVNNVTCPKCLEHPDYEKMSVMFNIVCDGDISKFRDYLKSLED